MLFVGQGTIELAPPFPSTAMVLPRHPPGRCSLHGVPQLSCRRRRRSFSLPRCTFRGRAFVCRPCACPTRGSRLSLQVWDSNGGSGGKERGVEGGVEGVEDGRDRALQPRAAPWAQSVFYATYRCTFTHSNSDSSMFRRRR